MLARDLLYASAKSLALAGADAPRLNAELLLMHVWHCDRIALISRSQHEVPETIRQTFEALLERRLNREPLAYILGEKEFWSRRFIVTPDVLIPRPETEHLIEAVLQRFPERDAPYRFCDIGTGSGCIAVTLACEYPLAHVAATDISAAALQIAARNASEHGVAERMAFLQGDILHPLAGSAERFDAIISNPPYVALAEMNDLDNELSFEPRQALTDEGDGLSFLQRIVDQTPEHLKQDGYVILETGPCGLPKPPTALILDEEIHDLAGHLRGAAYRSHI